MFDFQFQFQRDSFSLAGHLKTTSQSLALVGPSGSGKSTILRLLLGLEKEISTHVIWNSNILSSLPVWKRRISYVPQQNFLFPFLSVKENILVSKRANSSLLQEVIVNLEIETILHKSIRHLSGGEAQRVALARAIISQGDYYLLDEPFSALDKTTKHSVVTYLKFFFEKRNIPYMLVCHDERDIEYLCDEIWEIKEGKLLRLRSQSI
ncbi:MAG: ATP-binding cassette domain-containing protein [Bacteriovoracaceae bacterium]